MEKAKESTSKVLSRNLDAYGDEFRSQLLSFNNQIDAFNPTIEQDQRALDQITAKESEAEPVFVPPALGEEPAECTTETPARDEKRCARQVSEVLTSEVKAITSLLQPTHLSEATEDIEFYRTNTRPTQWRGSECAAFYPSITGTQMPNKCPA